MAYLIGCFYPAGAHVWIFAISNKNKKERNEKKTCRTFRRPRHGGLHLPRKRICGEQLVVLHKLNPTGKEITFVA